MGGQQTESDASIVVVTGLSGAGKTTALNALADLGYYCVDNMPPALAVATLDVCRAVEIERVALGMDVRVGGFLDELLPAIDELRRMKTALSVLYLDSADEALVRRFGETRRPHPIFTAVALERERLADIRTLATHEVDTTHLTVHELRRLVLERFGGGAAPQMLFKLLSFGFKHGVPLDANLMFDVRFLDNPHFHPELREMTGNDGAVRDFVLAADGADELVSRLEALLSWALPRYAREGKTYLTTAIGCTGGRHRSVAIANELARRLSAVSGLRVGIVHRDVLRGAIMTEVSAEDPQTAWSSQSPSRERSTEGESA
jgi:UPF0042 nucleotide-binding protein